MAGLSRRRLVCASAGVALAGGMPALAAGPESRPDGSFAPAPAEAHALSHWVPAPAGVGQGFWEQPRQLWLRRASAGEAVRLTYWRDGRYDPAAYAAVVHLLRDVTLERALLVGDARVLQAHRAGRLPDRVAVHAVISAPVLDALYAIGAWLELFGLARPIEISSAYRHPLTNDALIEGAARNSLHTLGRAVDLHIPGVDAAQIARFGAWLGVGGIGLYQGRGFVHMDDGRRRAWRG